METKTVAGRLIKEGYLKERHTSSEFGEAIARWRKDNPILKPMVPSLSDSYREAECLICRDGAWLHPLGVDGKPDYSRLIPCSCGEALDRANAQRVALERSGIPTVPRMYTFESFKLDDYTQGAGKAFDAASKLAMGKATFKLLLIFGPNGNGKSHLCYAAAVEAIKRRKKARYVNFLDLCSRARATIGKQEINMEDLFDEYKKCEFLCLDEVRIDGTDGWSARVLEDIIGYRYDHELETVVTTNHNIDDLPAPVKSRFSEKRLSLFVQNSAPDYRPRTRRKP